MHVCTVLDCFYWITGLLRSQPCMLFDGESRSSAATVLVLTQSMCPKELGSGALEHQIDLSTGTLILVSVRFPICIRAVCCAAVPVQNLERWPTASLHVLYACFWCACGPTAG